MPALLLLFPAHPMDFKPLVEADDQRQITHMPSSAPNLDCQATSPAARFKHFPGTSSLHSLPCPQGPSTPLAQVQHLRAHPSNRDPSSLMNCPPRTRFLLWIPYFSLTQSLHGRPPLRPLHPSLLALPKSCSRHTPHTPAARLLRPLLFASPLWKANQP